MSNLITTNTMECVNSFPQKYQASISYAFSNFVNEIKNDMQEEADLFVIFQDESSLKRRSNFNIDFEIGRFKHELITIMWEDIFEMRQAIDTACEELKGVLKAELAKQF